MKDWSDESESSLRHEISQRFRLYGADINLTALMALVLRLDDRLDEANEEIERLQGDMDEPRLLH
jgi:DNA polymerase III delta subunit